MGSDGKQLAASGADSDTDPAEKESFLPAFVRRGTRTDLLLFIGFALVTVYGLALFPFRAKLLVDLPFLSIILSGGNFSTVALAAQHQNDFAFIALVVVIAALSAIKFLPLYYLMGKRWGDGFLEMLFKSHTPLWFKRLRGFIYRHPALTLALAFIPFSPISAAIVVAVAGIAKANGRVLAVCAAFFSLLAKIFYAALGVIFGEQVIATLQVIDRYMLWITIGLAVYIFITVFGKEFTAGYKKEMHARKQRAEQDQVETAQTAEAEHTKTTHSAATERTAAPDRSAETNR